MECICVETPPPQTKQNKPKKTVPLRSTVQTPTLFFDSIQIDAPQFFFFFSFHRIFIISARGLQINHSGPIEDDIYCIYSWNYRLAIKHEPAAEC